MIKPYFKSKDKAFILLHGDVFELLPQFDFKFDMVFLTLTLSLENFPIKVARSQ
jgi:site-specific DNA-methyltransferase (adenine-specific)